MGPLSLEAGLACLRVAGSGHPSLFIGVMGGLPLWEHRMRQNQSPERALNTQINTYATIHIEFLCHAVLNEDGGSVTV